MSTKSLDFRSQGRKLTATDLAERLLPDLSMNELLLWSPDLFAFTSYIMSHTGAYQLVVSPPTGKTWKPQNKELKEWLGIETNKSAGGNIVIKDIGLKKNLKNWLEMVFERRSSKEKTDVQTERRKKSKYPIRWGLETTKWKEYKDSSEKDHFGSSFLSTIQSTEVNNNKNFIVEEIVKHITDNFKDSKDSEELFEKLHDDDSYNWVDFVQSLGDGWAKRLNNISDYDFHLINDAELDFKTGEPIIGENGKITQWKDEKYRKFNGDNGYEKRGEELFGILLKFTPPLLIACWAYFYNQITDYNFYENKDNRKMEISDLLCNRDDIQINSILKEKLWKVSQSLITMHAIADICCTKWGITAKDDKNKNAKWFAEKLLFEKGSLATINPERGRVMPKRHNPGVGITLRSISSNLGFHRSSVEVAWRKTSDTQLEKRLDDGNSKSLSMLLLPFPLDIKAKDFGEDKVARKTVELTNDYGFFEYNPQDASIIADKIVELIKIANNEFADDRGDKVDIIVFPEGALSKTEYNELAGKLEKLANAPSLFIAGVRESRFDVWKEIPNNAKDFLSERKSRFKEVSQIQEEIQNVNPLEKQNLEAKLKKLIEELDKDKNEKKLADEIVNFSRNALYCQYCTTVEKDKDGNSIKIEDHKGKYYHRTDDADKVDCYEQTPKYKQYKHHRWQLDNYQIERYGLSSILPDKKIWWESMKVSKRRVSFLNVGNRLTISHLVCEDLARQDPISDLIRHVGPSLVVTLLMDGPQLKHRWSYRYASVLSDDPGCSVITLTSWGMTKRYSTGAGLMSKVVALWSESKNSKTREIELADGAEAILLTLKIDMEAEKTADGRMERENEETSVLRLVDVIQIYAK